MRYMIIAAGIVLTALLIVLIIGWRLPVAHVATRSAQFPVDPATMFALISDFDRYGTWRTGVKRVEVDSVGKRFREHGPDGALLFDVTESDPPRRLVVRIADESLPFGGRWIYDVSPSAAGSLLRITEEGEVYNPLFRFIARYVMGHARTIDRFLADVSVNCRRRSVAVTQPGADS
jgi:hypothetical protein